MEVTPEFKADIDSKTYEELLSMNRFSPLGDPMFQGERGEYILKRMAQLRKQVGHEEHVRVSKSIGWGA